MKKLLFCLFLIYVNITALLAQEIDRTTYRLMSRNDAVRHWFDAGRPAGGRYILEGHFVRVGRNTSGRNEMWFFSDGGLFAFSSNITPTHIPRGQAVHIYYRIFSRHGGNTEFVVDHIEIVDRRFFIGHLYPVWVNLNMRSMPNTSSRIITTVQRGFRVWILEIGEEATIDDITSVWVRVRANMYGEPTGWMFGGYLEYNHHFFEQWSR